MRYSVSKIIDLSAHYFDELEIMKRDHETFLKIPEIKEEVNNIFIMKVENIINICGHMYDLHFSFILR
ncbi:hypothetical protein RclHR1_06700004 [Rhizophagus clarus]|uniref:Uncharacterized protein n=1 Tax=Rhizophagus clarus TaxID=94130 RepID=A0A2Z6S9P1_9GLOM|nr:hypothetical protein RclHR1_06700004 [Rhizophagus clarus]GES95785.1 hypothetical protein RCL_e23622_RclHR1_06700004 [Rhizophagus clarus]